MLFEQLNKKLKTVLWFLKKPQYIPHIFQVLKRRDYTKLEDTREEATNWCREVTISANEVIEKIIGMRNYEELNLIYPEIINYANQQVKNCPVTMGGEGAISFLYHIAKGIKVKRIIETGVAYGWSALSILLAIKGVPDAKLISNDMPYIKMNNDNYVGCIIPDELKGKWELQRLPDVTGISLAIKKFNGQIDLCHYDSDKSYAGRMFAYPLLWNSLRNKGVFLSDDIQDNIAFKIFSESINCKPLVFEYKNKYVGVLIK
jgi:hypothetical protein